ncbi:reactive oxygen species modulator 1, partial [Syncephalis fuscata]
PSQPTATMPVREPTVFDKLKMGAMMGGTVGLCIGLVFGTVNVVRFGPGQHGYLGTLGRSMASSAGFFGLLMAVGSVVRSEE